MAARRSTGADAPHFLCLCSAGRPRRWRRDSSGECLELLSLPSALRPPGTAWPWNVGPVPSLPGMGRVVCLGEQRQRERVGGHDRVPGLDSTIEGQLTASGKRRDKRCSHRVIRAMSWLRISWQVGKVGFDGWRTEALRCPAVLPLGAFEGAVGCPRVSVPAKSQDTALFALAWAPVSPQLFCRATNARIAAHGKVGQARKG